MRSETCNKMKTSYASAQVIENKRSFKTGADQFQTKLLPTLDQIVEGMKKNQFNNDKIVNDKTSHSAVAYEIHRPQTNKRTHINIMNYLSNGQEEAMDLYWRRKMTTLFV